MIVLHGSNVDLWSKLDPIHFGALDDAALDLMSTWFGFDAARLLVFWSAVEPQEGVIDEAYLDALVAEIERYQAHDLHVIVDMHQDCPPSAAFRPDPGATEYDGAPPWAATITGTPYRSSGGQWVDCVAPAVQAYLRAMFDPATAYPELAEHYGAALARVVERTHALPAVLGYDVMNEPLLWLGEMARVGLASVRGAPSNPILTDFTQRLVDTVRSVDPDTYVFVEPSAILVNPGFRSDLGLLTDPRPGPPRLVLAPHLYPIPGVDEPLANLVARWSDARDADRQHQTMPWLLGEFGSSDREQIERVLAMADAKRMSWTQWAWSGHWPVVDRGGAPTASAGYFRRVYPRAVAGLPRGYAYDPASRLFQLAYDAKPDARGPTEIGIPIDGVYPDGWALVVDGAATATEGRFDPGRGILRLDLEPRLPHTVCIAPTATACGSSHPL